MLVAAAVREYLIASVTNGMAPLWPHLQKAWLEDWRRELARLRTAEEVNDELGGVAAWALAATLRRTLC
jgi:hypothetical protein